jgi:hypothetical protein
MTQECEHFRIKLLETIDLSRNLTLGQSGRFMDFGHAPNIGYFDLTAIEKCVYVLSNNNQNLGIGDFSQFCRL